MAIPEELALAIPAELAGVEPVIDRFQELAGIIKLATYSSFSLYRCHEAVISSKSSDSGNGEEYFMLDNNEHIGDLVAYFKAVKDRGKRDILHSKLLLKRKLFRESDEAVTDPMFLHLSYVQLQHDYILGNYPIERDTASKLSALQILAEIGFVRRPESCNQWDSFLERFLPRQIATTRARGEWESDILSCYHSLEHMTKEDVRQQFLHIFRALPYGFSVIFNVRKVDYPIGLLPPGQIILGVNKRGVHFFCPNSKKRLHSVELDEMEFGSRDTALFFKMRVADFPHSFQFETKQAGEICAALQTYVNDVLLCRYSKVRSSNDHEDEMLQELEGLIESLSFYKDSLSQVRLLCDAKDKELQVAEETNKSLANDKLSLTQKFWENAEEMSSLQLKHEQERTALKSQVSDLEQERKALNSKVSDLEQERTALNSQVSDLERRLVTAESLFQ